MRARKGRRAILTTLIAAGCLTVAPALLCALESETAETTETTHTLVGSYLAGRFAKNQHETDNAADFYRSALTQDPGSDLLLEQAFLMEATLARWPRALKLAEELVAVESQHRMARLFLGLNEFKAWAYKKAEEHIRAAASGPIAWSPRPGPSSSSPSKPSGHSSTCAIPARSSPTSRAAARTPEPLSSAP